MYIKEFQYNFDETVIRIQNGIPWKKEMTVKLEINSKNINP